MSDAITFQEESSGDVIAYRGNGRIRVICHGHQTGNDRLQAIAQGAFQIGIQEQQRRARVAFSRIIMGE